MCNAAQFFKQVGPLDGDTWDAPDGVTVAWTGPEVVGSPSPDEVKYVGQFDDGRRVAGVVQS